MTEGLSAVLKISVAALAASKSIARLAAVSLSARAGFGVSSSLGGFGFADDCVSAWPHSGQNIACSRIDAPQDSQRCEISGCDINFEFRISDFELLNQRWYLNSDKVVFKFAIRNSHFAIPRSDASR